MTLGEPRARRALLDRAEDPQETLDYSYENSSSYCRTSSKASPTSRPPRGASSCRQASWSSRSSTRTQARRALSAGREELARAALERKQLGQTEPQSLDSQVAELENQQQRLIENEQRQRAKIEAFRTKKEVIKAQYSASRSPCTYSRAGSATASLGST